MKCNASKSSEGNTTKTLKCDDECARLERNRRLALALNVDPTAHKDDHIPYSTQTLTMFAEGIKWAQTQEREFRVFATDENEKRLRFKPMPNHQRAFIHSLAEDFGLDHESLDPEPHRHVFVLKTPRFVSAPNKTLAECLRIRNQAAALTAAASASLPSKKAQPTIFEPFNAFLLTNPRFGLTIEEVRADLHTTLSYTPSLKFDISFLPSEQVALKASSTTHLPSSTIETHLKSLKPSLTSQVTATRLAADVRLCTLDNSLNILYLQDDTSHGASGGWSQVAAKAAVGPRTAPRLEGVGSKSSFTVLGRGEARKKKEREEKERRERQGSVVEDWEEAVRKEEEGEMEMEKEKEKEKERVKAEEETLREGEDSGQVNAGHVTDVSDNRLKDDISATPEDSNALGGASVPKEAPHSEEELTQE